MSITDNTNKLPVFAENTDQWHLLFDQLEPQHVEGFYQHYQHWQKLQRAAAMGEQIAAIEQHIVNNTILMQNAQPSPIALATLTRLQSSGVEDIDLLDALLERGDTWLDHTMQLLERCEELDLIHDNYTEWCRLALEGAYDWLDSVKETAPVTQQPHNVTVPAATIDDSTESLFLEKLMSEDETVKISAIAPTSKGKQISQAEETLASSVATPSAIVIPTRLSYVASLTKTEVIDTQVSIAPAIALPTKLSYVSPQETLVVIQNTDEIPTANDHKPLLTLPTLLSYVMKIPQGTQENNQLVALSIPVRLSYTLRIVAPALIIAEPANQHGEEQPAQLPEGADSPTEEQPQPPLNVQPEVAVPLTEKQPAQPPDVFPEEIISPIEEQPQQSPEETIPSIEEQSQQPLNVQPKIVVPPIEEQRLPAPPEKQQKSPKRGLVSRILTKIWQT